MPEPSHLVEGAYDEGKKSIKSAPPAHDPISF